MAERSRTAQIADRFVASVSAIFATVFVLSAVNLRYPNLPEWLRVTLMTGGLFGFGWPAFQWRDWRQPVIAVAITVLISLTGVMERLPRFVAHAFTIGLFLALGIALVQHYRRRRTS